MTSVDEIASWFDEGVRFEGLAKLGGQKPDYMLVVCDTFSNEDYPVYATTETFWDEHDRLHEQNMQRVIEVYDLHANVNQQMQERRAWHPPERPVPADAVPAGNYLAQAQAADEAVDRLNSTAPLRGRLPGFGEIDMGVTIEMLASVCERFIERELDVDLNDGERQTLREYLVFGGPMEVDPNERVR